MGFFFCNDYKKENKMSLQVSVALKVVCIKYKKKIYFCPAQTKYLPCANFVAFDRINIKTENKFSRFVERKVHLLHYTKMLQLNNTALNEQGYHCF